jgi:hypothetical protein
MLHGVAQLKEKENNFNMSMFTEIGERIGKITEEKNEAYGNSFELCGHILQRLYPLGIRPDQYTDALLVVRIIDKLFRIATRKDAFGESPYADITGYGICGVVKDQRAMGIDK